MSKKSNIEMATPTDECVCHHMIKSHKQSFRWNKKKGYMDVRLKCRYCKCNILLEPAEGILE